MFGLYCNVIVVDDSGTYRVYVKLGPVRDLNPGPLAPEAKIIPLDQQAVNFILFDIQVDPKTVAC